MCRTQLGTKRTSPIAAPIRTIYSLKFRLDSMAFSKLRIFQFLIDAYNGEYVSILFDVWKY